MNDLKPLTAAIVTFIFIAGIAATAIYDLQPPKPLPATAPDSLFSADRAAGYIRDIAASPHPLGSPENVKVRDYIVEQLSEMGLQPRLDTAVVTGSYLGIHYAASVINIVAHLTGSDNSRAVLLMAHYDSVPTGPGASDDGSGVATILETLRALKASYPLKNDVIAIFTDGEENGMMGAQAIAGNDSLLRQVGVALNFEARGTSGPSLMFETSDGNGWLIEQMAKSGSDIAATSFMYDGYKHLPNNTDFSWLKAKGMSGMNFAFIGDLERYHSEMDNYTNIDERSIQHDGSHALSLTKQFGNLTLPGPGSGNDIYFNFFWPAFFYYPASYVSTISAVAALLFFLMIYIGVKRKMIGLWKSLISILLPLGPVVILAVGTFFLWKGIGNSYPEAGYFLFDAFYGDGMLLLAVISLALAATSTFFIYMRGFFRSSEMAAGALFWWLVLAVISTFYLPHGAYIFQWPLLFSSSALLLFFIAPKSDFRSPLMLLTLLACAVPGVYFTAQTVYLLYLMGLLPAVTTAIVVLVILGMCTVLPHLAIVSAPKKWIIPVSAFAVALVIGAVALMSHHLDTHHPKTDSIDYAIDLDNSRAYWISFDDTTDEWTSQYMQHFVSPDSLPDFFPGRRRPDLANSAALIPVRPVSVTLLGDTAYRGAQEVTLLVKPPEAGTPIMLHSPKGSQVISASVDGHPIPDSVAIFPTGKLDNWTLYCYGFPAAGCTVSLVLPAGQELNLTTVCTLAGLPEAGGLPEFPRPGSIMRRPFVTTDAAIVMKSYRF